MPSGPRVDFQSWISFCVAKSTVPSALQVEAPQLARAADGVVIVVGDEEIFVVRRDDEAVGPIDFVGDDARDFAVRVDAIDAFDLAGRRRRAAPSCCGRRTWGSEK